MRRPPAAAGSGVDVESPLEGVPPDAVRTRGGPCLLGSGLDELTRRRTGRGPGRRSALADPRRPRSSQASVNVGRTPAPRSPAGRRTRVQRVDVKH
jgi:hypothetical protein